MSKALAIDPDIGLREILEVSQGNSYDVVYNPTLQGPGNTIGGTFIKPAPVHEGASTEFARNGGDPDALPGDVSVAQLEDFQDRFESSNNEDMGGMTVLRKEGGEHVVCSYRAGQYAEFAGNGETLTNGGVSLNQALDTYVQATGRQLRQPTVY